MLLKKSRLERSQRHSVRGTWSNRNGRKKRADGLAREILIGAEGKGGSDRASDGRRSGIWRCPSQVLRHRASRVYDATCLLRVGRTSTRILGEYSYGSFMGYAKRLCIQAVVTSVAAVEMREILRQSRTCSAIICELRVSSQFCCWGLYGANGAFNFLAWPWRVQWAAFSKTSIEFVFLRFYFF